MDKEMVVNRSWNLLKYSYGLTLLLLGLDKVFSFNLIANWPTYVSDFALTVLPFSALTIVLALGVAEILVGVMMLTKWTKLAAIISMVTLIVIVINLLTMGLYDIAARDVLIALGALVLVWLSEVTPGQERLI